VVAARRTAEIALASGSGPVDVVLRCTRQCRRKVGEIQRAPAGPIIVTDPRLANVSESRKNPRTTDFAYGDHRRASYLKDHMPGESLWAECLRHGAVSIGTPESVRVAMDRARRLSKRQTIFASRPTPI
jgi:hypothetical protein